MLEAAAASLLVTTLGAHLGSTLIAMKRCWPRRGQLQPPAAAPHVTILRPVCGVEPYDERTLASTFRLDYPNLRLVFCCDRGDDPAAALVRRLIEKHPGSDARLLIGRTPQSANPKLNNLLKGWPHVETDWVVMADSNVDMPPDYVQRLLAAWKPGTGVICAPPIGDRPHGFWGEVECAFLNTYQARWQYASDTIGLGFAQGKTMLFRRADLEAAGGLAALGAEVAEDAAATKLVRGMGLKARLVDGPFMQPLGRRRLQQVWDRQARWARLRRMTFPAVFLPEVLTSGLMPMVCAAVLAAAVDVSPLSAAASVAVLWYGAEWALARACGWHHSWRSPFAGLLRDIMLPALWLQAWFINSFIWRGNEISPESDEPVSSSA